MFLRDRCGAGPLGGRASGSRSWLLGCLRRRRFATISATSWCRRRSRISIAVLAMHIWGTRDVKPATTGMSLLCGLLRRRGHVGTGSGVQARAEPDRAAAVGPVGRHRAGASWVGGEDRRDQRLCMGCSCLGLGPVLRGVGCRAPLLVWVLGLIGSGDKMAIGVSRRARPLGLVGCPARGRQRQGCRELAGGSSVGRARYKRRQRVRAARKGWSRDLLAGRGPGRRGCQGVVAAAAGQLAGHGQ
jgi:hypothetical protein